MPPSAQRAITESPLSSTVTFILLQMAFIRSTMTPPGIRLKSNLWQRDNTVAGSL